MGDMLITVVVFWMLFGVITMFIARSKGRNMIGWFFIGLFLSWIGLIIILFMGKTAAAAAKHNVKVAQGMMDILFEAAKGGTASEVRDALAAGVDPGARNEYGVTPLHRAARFNSNPSVVKALIEAGADPGTCTEYDITPLHYAARFNSNPSVIKALIEAGADPGARDAKYGETPLHLAAHYNANPSVIVALIEGCADPGARTEYDITPLHSAARFNSNPSVIVMLIEGGADPSARDDNGKIPFDYAKEKNKTLMGTDAYRMLNAAGLSRPP